MIRLIKKDEGKRMGLPGRSAVEKVSGETGSRFTFRVVEIPVPAQGERFRGPHLHHGYEECIYVLSGSGINLSEDGELPVRAGDVLVVPPETKHVTRNTGNQPLVLLCYFASPDVGNTTNDYSAF
jgi:mannose-6-phosphate isomerase-like protein (cupin superfamily)